MSLLVGLSVIFGLVLPVGAAQAGLSDVEANAWYAQDVSWCVEHGLMDGTSGQTFSPDQPAVRAVLVEALYCQAGSPEPEQSATFSDVAPDSPYYRAVSWAAEKRITTGYGGGRFGGGDPVTREQFAAFLWRAAGEPNPGESESFADQARISGYAVSAVVWARSQGIIKGKARNQFDPQARISRAEAAAMFHRWLEQNTDNENKGDPAKAAR
ncbi:MAG: S-layer homology domain-containing protein [Oscillospiraceae bacterium]|nr:S-layer homology domain-containing protein [Oscillospiraceae bacterium]